MHAGTTFGAFVGYHNNVARHHFAAEDALHGVVLRLVDLCRSFEVENAFVDACGLNHTTVEGDVAVEHSQTAVFDVGMLEVADASAGTVAVEAVVIVCLAAEHDAAHVARSALPQMFGIVAECAAANGVTVDGFAKGQSVDATTCGVDEPVFRQFGHYRHNAAGTVDVLYVIF